MMAVYFLDTNVLLQCGFIAELPWIELRGDADVLLMITRPVQEEIDRLKADGNSRRARRARKITALLNKVLMAKDERVTVRESRPRVEVALSPTFRKPNDLLEDLDLSRADDRIVAELIYYLREHPGEAVWLASNDINMNVTAKRCGVQFKATPETWFLPPEADSRDKKIRKLEEENRTLRIRLPDLKWKVRPENGDDRMINLARYEISDQRMAAVMKEVQHRFPMARNLNESTMETQSANVLYSPPDAESIVEYQEIQYPDWLQQVKKAIRKFQLMLEYPTRVLDLEFTLENLGARPAENLVIEFFALGGFLFEPPDFKHRLNEPRLVIPRRPAAPKGRRIISLDLPSDSSPNQKIFTDDLLESISRLSSFDKVPVIPLAQPETERDPNRFYWKEETNDKFQAFVCEEFQHKSDPEIFRIRIVTPKDSELRGAMGFRIAARNLPDPIKGKVPIRVSVQTQDLEPQVLLEMDRPDFVASL